jgi:hypothetical protein
VAIVTTSELLSIFARPSTSKCVILLTLPLLIGTTAAAIKKPKKSNDYRNTLFFSFNALEVKQRDENQFCCLVKSGNKFTNSFHKLQYNS